MMTESNPYHVPVMLAESVGALVTNPNGIYVDVTFGGGGHSREILRRLGPSGRLFGFDQDADALHNAPEGDARFTFVWSNFRHLRNWMRYYGVEAVDGLLADLGVSAHHLDEASRGFSFRFDAPLDMRMNQRATATAAEIVNGYGEEVLADLFRRYGELRDARRLAAAIVTARRTAPVETTGDLLRAVEPLLPAARRKKDAAKLFQALRIEVNREMQALEEMLASAIDLLAPGGRLVVITYHSLEDRMVKNFMRTGNAEGQRHTDLFGNATTPLRPVGSKPATPTDAELQANPRSRSAKLRVAEKAAAADCRR